MSESSSEDPFISEAEQAEQNTPDAERAANLFDLRRIIGGLFAIYGVILIVLGLGASNAEKEKAAGWNLNLYVGLALLVISAIFLIWAFTRPLGQQLEEVSSDDDRPRASH
jgi:hypothetical protein